MSKNLQNQCADYGKQIVSTLSTQLKSNYGRNFEERNLRRMLQFAKQFSEYEIGGTLSRQLTWSHFLNVIFRIARIHNEFKLVE